LPLYEYKCVKCGHRFERIEKLSAPTTQKCPKCGKKAERQLSSPAIQFKGSGWYVTDYGGKSGSSSSEGSGDSSSAKGDAKAADAKSSDSKSSDSKESKPAASDSSNKGAAKRKK